MDEVAVFTYCPKCASTLVSGAHGNKYCPQCGSDFYFNAKPCMASIILDEEKNTMLFVKRAREPRKDTWDLPGGFIDAGETFEEGTLRELKEEIGLKEEDVLEMKYLFSTVDRYLYKGIHYHTTCFWTKVTVKKPYHLTPNDDVSEIAWFPLDQLPWETMSFNGEKVGIKKFLEEGEKVLRPLRGRSTTTT